jgi:sarcosine oxidase
MAGRRSIDAYADLEAHSGIRFHEAVGCLRISADPAAEDDTLRQAEENGTAYGAVYSVLAPAESSARFPYLNFPDDARIVHEEGGAGYVNPRSLVAAQLICAVNGGGSIVRARVTSVQPADGCAAIRTMNGETIRAGKALITAGAWCNMLLESPLSLLPRAATTLLAEIEGTEVKRLSGMPSVIYRLRDHPDLYSIYALPPIRYPDGKMYVKIGGTFHCREHFEEMETLDAWFHTSGDRVKGQIVKDVLLSMLLGLRAESFHTVPCVVTYTTHDHPYIDEIAPNITVGVGGNGAAAKSSNEIGRIAALAAVNDKWVSDYDPSAFAVIYAKKAG